MILWSVYILLCIRTIAAFQEGKLATGILTPLVKNAGFGNVSDFLDKGTDDIAKVLQWKSPDAAEAVRQRCVDVHASVCVVRMCTCTCGACVMCMCVCVFV